MRDDGYFGESVAANYDRDHGRADAEEVRRTVNCLQALAGDGPVLEFAIGTGRIALPLAECGLVVKGIELSHAMVAQMQTKPGGGDIDVVIGDMTSTRVEGRFSLVYLVFNTIDNLTTQEAQVACFENAARHLAPGGRFLVETMIPPIRKVSAGESTHAFAADDDHFGIDVFDFSTQTYTSRHLRRNGQTFTSSAIPFRYAWPAEMDLMARIAGLRLESRWGDWEEGAFDGESERHVSVWGRN